jgi:hypothetical protein
MLKVKIESITGFGKTAEFATINLMHYDLSSGSATASVNLYEADPMPGSPATVTAQIMTKHIICTPEDTASWGTDDMVFIDVVLEKAGLVRDTEWVQPEPTPVTPPPADPTPAPELP